MLLNEKKTNIKVLLGNEGSLFSYLNTVTNTSRFPHTYPQYVHKIILFYNSENNSKRKKLPSCHEKASENNFRRKKAAELLWEGFREQLKEKKGLRVVMKRVPRTTPGEKKVAELL
ncbi:hypothetical protein V7201_02835 [Bacillus sp. JJ1122]